MPFLRCLLALLAAISLFSAERTTGKRKLELEDLSRLHDVANPEVSPDGNWVAYTVSTIDRDADKRLTHIWMANWDGTVELQITNGSESESSPRWSPDGKYLSFVSSRAGKAKGSQIWVVDRRGGEARQLTHIKDYTISGYDWSPDATKLALVLREKDEPDSEETKPATPKSPKPIVIDRYHFKQDMEGYLNGKHNHIYLFDIATEKLDPITSGNFDESNASWSPDGLKIAFVSNQDKDPDRTENSDLFVVEGAAERDASSPDNPSGPRFGSSSLEPR